MRSFANVDEEGILVDATSGKSVMTDIKTCHIQVFRQIFGVTFALLTTVYGTSVVRDSAENRFMHVVELNRMGVIISTEITVERRRFLSASSIMEQRLGTNRPFVERQWYGRISSNWSSEIYHRKRI